MACRFRVTDIDNLHCLMSIADKDVPDDQHRLIAAGGPAGDPVQASSFDGTLSEANTTTGFSANTWHHAAGVFTATNSRTAYIDGGSNSTNSDTRNVVNIDAIELGVTADSTPIGFMDGDLAEAAVWNVALTSVEVKILSLGYSPLSVRPQSLAFYAKLIKSEDIDIVGGLVLSANGTPTTSRHPSVIYPAPLYAVPMVSLGMTQEERFSMMNV